MEYKLDHFLPLHLQNCLPDDIKSEEIKIPNAEILGKNGFYIPIGQHVSKKIKNTLWIN